MKLNSKTDPVFQPEITEKESEVGMVLMGDGSQSFFSSWEFSTPPPFFLPHLFHFIMICILSTSFFLLFIPFFFFFPLTLLPFLLHLSISLTGTWFSNEQFNRPRRNGSILDSIEHDSIFNHGRLLEPRVSVQPPVCNFEPPFEQWLSYDDTYHHR